MDLADTKRILAQFLDCRCILKESRLFLTVQVTSIDISDWGAILKLLPLAVWSEELKEPGQFEVSARWDNLSCDNCHLFASYIGWELAADPETVRRVEEVGAQNTKGEDRVHALLAAFRGRGEEVV